MRDLVEIADYLEALSAGEGHAGHHQAAKALFDAARLLRARNEQEDTQPLVCVCPECGFVFGLEPDEA